MKEKDIILLDEALKKKGFTLASDVLRIIEEFREKKKLTFEQAAENVENMNNLLKLNLCGDCSV